MSPPEFLARRWVTSNGRRAVLAVAAALYVITMLYAPWTARGSARVVQALPGYGVPLTKYGPLFSPPDCVALSGGFACRYELNLSLLLSGWIFIAIVTAIAWVWIKSVPSRPETIARRYCNRCGNETTSLNARFCDQCGQAIPLTDPNRPRPANSAADRSESPSVPHATPKSPRWYEGTRNAIGFAVLSFFIYVWVLMTAVAGATLRGNEAIYVTGWTSIVFYAMWKRRGWKGWLGGLVGLIVGLVIIILASTLAGINR